VPFAFKVEVELDSQGFVVDESLEFVLKGAQAFVCPVELGLNAP
jgi:hypothetical protein